MAKKESKEFNQKEVTDQFFSWFFDKNPQSEIPQSVLHYKSPITHNTILTMFSKYPEAFIHLNKHFNTYDCYRLDKKDLLHYAKQLGQKFNVKQNQMWWLQNWKKKDDFISSLISKAPYLKKDDIRLIRRKLEADGMEHVKSRVDASLGLDVKPKKEKLTKEDKNKVKEAPKKMILIDTVKVNLQKNIKNKECCQKCSLKEKDYTLMDWGNISNVEPIDILYLGEAPGAEEVEGDKKPFVGRAGQTLRKQMSDFSLQDLKYVIFNTVLCRPDDNVLTPHKDAISNCSEFLDRIIQAFNPKLIVALGATAMSRMGLEGQISKNRGFHKYKGIDIFVTFHPSYILRGSGKNEWNEDFSLISSKFQKKEYANENKMLQIDSSEKLYPEFASVSAEVINELRRDDIYLINVEHIYNKNKIAYTYRDIKTRKKNIILDSTYTYFFVPKEESSQIKHIVPLSSTRRLDYYDYYSSKDSSIVFPVSYESDVMVADKRSEAYYSVKRDKETPVDLNFVVIDIECPMEDDTFPDPKEAPAAINCLGIFSSVDKTNLTLVLNPPGKSYTDTLDTKYYKTEKDLLIAFNNALINLNPDIITGWNVLFDIHTIINRMLKNGLNPNSLSNIKGAKVECDSENYRCTIPGFVVVDYMYLYKQVYGKTQESYSLANISEVELGKTKVEYEGTLYELYINNLQKYIEYNKTDCELVYLLDQGYINDKGKRKGGLGYLDLSNELRRLTGTTWDSCLRSSGLCDGLVVQYLHEKGLVVASRSTIKRGEKQDLPGAYVKMPSPGIYSYVVDLDAASLYPSIMISYNLGTESYYASINDYEAKEYLYDRENFMLKDEVEVIMNPLYEARIEKMSPEKFCNMIEVEKLAISISGDMYKRADSEVGQSLLSEIVSDLIKQRKVYKKKMFEAENRGEKALRNMYHNKQWAYKILANALYGFLTFQGSRMYVYPIARTITLSGQEIQKVASYMTNQFLQNKK